MTAAERARRGQGARLSYGKAHELHNSRLHPRSQGPEQVLGAQKARQECSCEEAQGNSQQGHPGQGACSNRDCAASVVVGDCATAVSSPTQRSLAHLRDNGFIAEVVEKYNSFSRTRKDLWGWCDILALNPVDATILAVQTTTTSNMKARIQKITDSETVASVRKCGIEIHVHGWSKKKGRWQLRVADIS